MTTETISNTTFTLYQCSPLHSFQTKTHTFKYLRDRITERLYKELNWVVEQDVGSMKSTPAGIITSLQFEPLIMEDFIVDQRHRKSNPLQLSIACEIRGKTSRQSMIMLPAIKPPKENLSNAHLWFYPLIMSKLSKGVFNVVRSLFEELYSARMHILHIPTNMMEHIIMVNAESLCNIDLEDYQDISDTLLSTKTVGPLKLEYATQFSTVETIQFDIETEQVIKLCRLSGDSKDFYKTFCSHILNTTKINLSSLQLISISCHIVSLSLLGRFKIHNNGPKQYTYDMLYKLIELAFVELDDLSWVI